MKAVEVRHPLVQHKLSLLRRGDSSTKEFRELASELAMLLTYEATADLETEAVTVEGWAGPIATQRIKGRKITLVPILRAGLGMLEGMTALVPTAEVGFLGMARNEVTLEPATYAERLPDDLSDRQCFVLDPMLATGGSLSGAMQFLFDRGAVDVTAICLLGTPEGLARVERDMAGHDVTIVLGALDEGLDERGFIVPGLGDAGDRLYGTVGD